MMYEKSCGAVIFRNNTSEREFLLVLNKKNKEKGHWGFPKGHKEGSENEYETAAREIYEETGIEVVFYGNARAVSSYSPKEGVAKDAVYFLATPKNNAKITLQDSEIADFRWCSAAQAKALLTYDADILAQLERWL